MEEADMTVSNGSGERSMRAWWWALVVAVPFGLFVLTQLEPIQHAEGHLIRGLPWDVGKWDIIADIVAPVWVLSIVAVAALNRRLLDRFGADPAFTPKTWLGRRFATTDWVHRSTWFAAGGAALIAVLSWTREWARLGQQPASFWYALAIVLTSALLAIPLWWIRRDLARNVGARVEDSPAATRLDRYLFDDQTGPPRWRQALVFFGLVALAAVVVLGQLDALLQGMHPAGEPSSGLGSLPSLFDLDLSAKRGLIAERVGAWIAYGDVVGDTFASAHSVAVLSLLIDTFVLIPAYTVIVTILLLRARRSRHEDLVGGATDTYDLLILGAMVVLAVTVAADLIENAVTWRAIWWGWQDLTRIDAWHARVIWFASVLKTMGLALLVVAGILILALRRKRSARFVQSVIAVRGELLVLLIVAAALLLLPQGADVMRRWTVSVILITVVFATELAVLLHYTSSQTLRNLHATARQTIDGENPRPGNRAAPGGSRRDQSASTRHHFDLRDRGTSGGPDRSPRPAGGSWPGDPVCADCGALAVRHTAPRGALRTGRPRRVRNHPALPSPVPRCRRVRGVGPQRHPSGGARARLCQARRLVVAVCAGPPRHRDVARAHPERPHDGRNRNARTDWRRRHRRLVDHREGRP
jgi:hypothetical protein